MERGRFAEPTFIAVADSLSFRAADSSRHRRSATQCGSLKNASELDC
jgi:hypothetical protein